MSLKLLGNRIFWTGVICGVVVLMLGRVAINEATFPDLLIAPLLLNDSSARAEAIVVLGAGLVGDCVPNLNGVRRVVLGARLFREGRAPLLVITGGRVDDGACPVAEAMSELARDLGVPADKILIERESRNTWENGERTAPLLRERSVHRILIVTDRLHMRRAAGVFARLGFTVEPSAVPIYEGHPDNVSMLTAGMREAAALGYYRLRGWTAPELTATVGASTRAPEMSDGEGALDEARGGVSMTLQRDRSTGSGPVVILGASYAANWKVAELGGVPVVNAGVPGQISSEMLDRFDRDVVAARPRAVVMWGFINDIFRADDMERSRARVRESYLEMIKRARAEGIEPILATEVTIRPAKAFVETVMSTIGWLLGKLSYQDQVNRHVMELNQWLREYARNEAILVLDLQGALADADGQRRREYATDDGSHISAEGYDALTTYARPILTRHLGAAAREPAKP